MSVLPNGLKLHRIPLEGTRATTVLVAFEAGARAERKRENGIAHFLEHLVFKGGRKFSGYRAINDAAERLGAVLNAFTSHELVAFHITVRAEAVGEATDLLTDFLAYPRIDPDELERERGVIVQEIARANDQPSRVADDLVERAAFGGHQLGRTVLGPASNIRKFRRDQIQKFRRRQWGTDRAAAFVVGNTSHAGKALIERLFSRLPRFSEPAAYDRAPGPRRRVLTDRRDTNQSHLRLLWRPQVDPLSHRERAAFTVYATLLGGSMGSRLFDEIREQRGLCYSISAQSYLLPDVSLLYVSAGLESKKCLEAYARIGEIVEQMAEDGVREGELERARAYTAGKYILAFESTVAVARYAANQVVVFGDSPDPLATIGEIEKVGLEDVVDVASRVEGRPVVACVGPHEASEFD